ncbi:hypothetical protein NDU88_006365 [Pleurodeles waltl]|uniref:Uncharacterized protein n=1 Tax=Pleurodeles waltl TaxID=8319 RepID=A0AAV7N8F3_PLEWA|nr:hypothetical protein NDU88_006365 [Pleurodeles waltl]
MDTQLPSDNNTSGSSNLPTLRRTPRPLPLPDLSGDSDVQQESSGTPSASGMCSQKDPDDFRKVIREEEAFLLTAGGTTIN